MMNRSVASFLTLTDNSRTNIEAIMDPTKREPTLFTAIACREDMRDNGGTKYATKEPLNIYCRYPMIPMIVKAL